MNRNFRADNCRSRILKINLLKKNRKNMKHLIWKSRLLLIRRCRVQIYEIINRMRMVYNRVNQKFTAFYLHGRPLRFSVYKIMWFSHYLNFFKLHNKFLSADQNLGIFFVKYWIMRFIELSGFELTGFNCTTIINSGKCCSCKDEDLNLQCLGWNPAHLSTWLLTG